MTDLDIRVLGPVEALRGGIPLALGGKTTTVLASLAVARGQVSSVETLIDHVWGTELPTNPRAALHNGVSRLRRLLGDGVLERVSWGYRLAVDGKNLDVARFNEHLTTATQAIAARRDGDAISALDAALALWRQPVFGNVVSKALHDEVVPRLTERYLQAVELRAELCLRSGQHRMLAEELPEIARAHPLRERLTGQLMIALALTERQADALIAYDTLRRTLRDELGINPSALLQDLHLRILRADLALSSGFVS